jgi:hypothetical protein
VGRPHAADDFGTIRARIEELRWRHPSRFNIPKNTNPPKFLFSHPRQMNTRGAEMTTNHHHP